MQPLPLYHIDAELADLEAAMIDAGGTFTDEIEERHDTLLRMRADKVHGYVAVVRRCEISAEAVDTEIDRLTARRNALQNTANRLKSRLLDAMTARGEDSHDTPIGKVRVLTASRRPLHLLVEPDDLPQRFRRVKISADKTELAKALDAHDEDAVRLAEYGPASTFLRIY
jgi:hypothetical protein